MPDLGRLRWVMDVDTTRFDSSLRRARAGIRAVGAAMAAVGAGNILGAGAERATRIAQGAQATGADVKYLQEMEFAATQTGMAPGEFIQNMITFSRNVAQLREGRGPLKRIGGRASRALRDIVAAPGAEGQVQALAQAVSTLEPGMGGALLERAGFPGAGAYELFAQGPEGLAAERARFYKYGTAMTRPEAEAIKRGSDLWDAAWEGAGTYTAKGMGMAAEIAQGISELPSRVQSQGLGVTLSSVAITAIDRLVQALGINTQATQDNTRSGAKLAP